MIKKSINTILICIFLLGATFLQAQNMVTTADGEGADVSIYNDSDKGPSLNLGGTDNIEIRNHAVRARIGYIKFDISDTDKEAQDAIIGLNAQKSEGIAADTMHFTIYGMNNDNLDISK